MAQTPLGMMTLVPDPNQPAHSSVPPGHLLQRLRSGRWQCVLCVLCCLFLCAHTLHSAPPACQPAWHEDGHILTNLPCDAVVPRAPCLSGGTYSQISLVMQWCPELLLQSWPVRPTYSQISLVMHGLVRLPRRSLASLPLPCCYRVTSRT